MELKIAELIIAAKEFSEKSEKYYIYLECNFYFEEIELHIRTKVGHDFIEPRKIRLKNAKKENINEVIKNIENYRG